MTIPPVSAAGVAALPRRDDGASDVSGDRLRTACADMESLFLYQLMEEMRKTVPKTGLLDGGPGEETFTSLLHMSLARDLSAAQGLGLGDLLYEQLRGAMKNPAESSPLPKDEPVPADNTTQDEHGPNS